MSASAAVPASVPSAMGTKTTVTTHSFPWRAVACGRIGDFSQGYLWHCWSLIRSSPSHNPSPPPAPCHPTSQTASFSFYHHYLSSSQHFIVISQLWRFRKLMETHVSSIRVHISLKLSLPNLGPIFLKLLLLLMELAVKIWGQRCRWWWWVTLTDQNQNMWLLAFLYFFLHLFR